MPRIAKPHYVMALACYLAIPVLMITGVALSRLIDPEMARYSADYARNFRLLELAATGALMATTGLALLLWLISYYLVLKSRHRSLLWLALAAAGPVGFMFVTMLVDRAPAPGDLYQQFIGKLKLYWRIPLEIALFVSAWILAYQCVALKRELLIRFEPFRPEHQPRRSLTGRPHPAACTHLAKGSKRSSWSRCSICFGPSASIWSVDVSNGERIHNIETHCV
jgi:hypothetical protein